MLLYRLVYCVDCCIPVYWMCLGENVQVQKVKLGGQENGKNSFEPQEFLVFQCEACKEKKEKDSDEKIECCECKQSGGFLKKITFKE